MTEQDKQIWELFDKLDDIVMATGGWELIDQIRKALDTELAQADAGAAAAYRSEKARADLLERQYAELNNWWRGNCWRGDIAEYRADFMGRHIAERAALK